MNLPKLTVCIPTYNRSNCLPTALDSILEQIVPGVEIVICDNGSIDRTAQLVQEYVNKYPSITYFRFPKNVGPDRCFLQSIEAASGEYCWFLGDDDRIEEGSIVKVLQALSTYSDLAGISVRSKTFDQQLTKQLPSPLIQPHLSSDRLYENAQAIFQDLFTYFGYMSGQVCKRSIWKEAVAKIENIERFFNAYIILYVISKMVFLHPKWLYLHEASVHYRSANDSFCKELGIYRRFLLDVDGYSDYTQDLFGKWHPLRLCCLNQVCKKFISFHIRDIRIKKGVRFFSLKAFRDMCPKYWMIRTFWTQNLLWMVIPRPLLLLMRIVYRRFIKPYRRQAA